jgi:hypothetical protein
MMKKKTSYDHGEAGKVEIGYLIDFVANNLLSFVFFNKAFNQVMVQHEYILSSMREI